MKKLYSIFRKLSLAFYLLLFYQISNLCQFGGVRRNLYRMIIWSGGLLISFILWLIFRRFKETQLQEKELVKRKKIFNIELSIFLIGSLLFISAIIYSAIPYHGALSWKIDSFFREKKIDLVHNNFLETGVEGILEDLDEALDLPEELYLSNKFQMTFDGSGEIKTIYTFLYGQNKNGLLKTYLVDYDANKGSKMTVWTDGQTAADQDTQMEMDSTMRLDPLLMILNHSTFADDFRIRLNTWELQKQSNIYELLYYGERSFVTADGLIYLQGDANGDGIEEKDTIPMLYYGGELNGFTLSFHIPANKDITPARYIIDPKYITSSIIQQQQEEVEVEAAKEEEGWTVDKNTGSMYFFLDDTIGWSLNVVDAAAGSRFYALDQTTDGGATWERMNADPFLGNIGVVEGLIFYDENFGIAGLKGASGDYSRIFITKDAGLSFQEVILPMDQVKGLPDSAGEYGYSLEDYDYMTMPEKEGDTITIKLVSQEGEKEGIVFQSEYSGDNFKYIGIVE